MRDRRGSFVYTNDMSKLSLGLFIGLYFIDYIFGMVSFGGIELIAVARMLAISFSVAMIFSFLIRKFPEKVKLLLS